jgi:hypothetical protein
MQFTVELTPDHDVVEVHCDREGLDLLIRSLERLRDGGHDHLMTPAWAGWELTETKHGPSNELINHLMIRVT